MNKFERKNFVTFVLSFFVVCLFVATAQNLQITELESKAKNDVKRWTKDSLIESVLFLKQSSEQRIKNNEMQKASLNLLLAGRYSLRLGDKMNAKSLFEESRRLSLESASYDQQIESLGELALIELEDGRTDKCEKYLRDAENFLKHTQNPKTSAFILFIDSELNYSQRKIPSVIVKLNKAVNLLESSEFAEDKAKYLLNLGYAYLALEDKAGAMNSFNSSLEISRSIRNTRGIADTHIALGFAFSNYNERQKAINAYKYAEKLFVEDIDFDSKAMLYNGLGRIYMDYGEWQMALEYKKKALNLYEKINSKFAITATRTSVAILNSLVDPSNKSSVMRKFDSAYDFARSIDDNFYCAIIQQEIGNYYFRIKAIDSAFKYYAKSQRYFQKMNDLREMSFINSQTSQIHLERNNSFLARRRLNEALHQNQTILDKLSESETRYLLAKLDFSENRIDAALDNIEKSIGLTELLYSDVVNSNLKRKFFSNVFERYELYINLLMKMNRQFPNEDFEIRAFQAAEKSRSRSMVETLTLTEANFMKDADPGIIQCEREIRSLLNLKSDKLTDLLSQNTEKNEIDKLDSEIKELQHEIEDIKANLKQNSPIYSAIKNPEPFDVQLFQNQVLDENSLLLEFSFGSGESYLWLVGKNEVISYVLPSRDQIETRIQKLRESLGTREMKTGESIEDFQARNLDTENSYWREAHLLSDELLGQVSEKIAGKRLIIVPDGKLHYFPVLALPFPNSGKDEPILLTNESVYEPSAQTTLLFGKSRTDAQRSDNNLLVFADPIFAPDDSRIVSNRSTNEPIDVQKDLKDSFRFADSLKDLHRLPASKNEGDTIAELFGASGDDVLSGFSATRENVLNPELANYKVIHFATHGVVNEERPELSGIVLSGFDKSGQKLEQVVRLQDIYGMDLNSDLVVLSACNTGVGKDVKGEGLQSLNNAFLSVGAKTVVSSLWKVEDSATLELMKNFYGTLAEGESTPSMALRDAQIKMWNNPRFKSPFYWAAFTVQGDFMHVPDVSNRSFFRNRSRLLLIGGGVVLGLLLLFFFFRKRSQSIRNA